MKGKIGIKDGGRACELGDCTEMKRTSGEGYG